MAIFPRILLCFALQCILVNGDVLIATVPNLVRVGNNETVLVTIEKDTSNGEDIPVSVALKNDDNSIIDEVTITTVEDRNKPVNYGIASMYIDPESITSSGNPEISRYVTVTVTCDALGFSQNKRVLLNMEGGFFFIQTDKPIYNPDQSVKIRFISLNQKLTPLQQEMQFDIRTPQDIVVERKVIAPERNPSGLLVKVYKIPEEPMLGNWSIVAYYGKDLKLNRIVQFEVREYVLPTFYVEISPPSYILRSTRTLSVTVNARYVYDQPVIGGSMLKIGLMDPDGEVEMKGSDIQSLAGGSARHAPDITAVLGENWYRDNVGHNLYLEASVWEGATGHFENASDISTKIVESGYIIGREKTLQYFKKGLPFPVKIDLKFPNGEIAPHVPVTLEAICHESNDVTTSILTQHNTDREDHLQTTRSDLSGNIHFILYDTGECNEISVTITTNDTMLMVEGDPSMNSNARMTFTIEPYESPGGGNEYILIRPPGESDGTIGYGRRFSLEVIAITELSPLVHIYIISRGEIVHYDVTEVRRDGSNNIGGFTISATADMIPSSRIVAFFMGRDNNIIADSLKVEFQRECENRISVSIVSKDTVQATSLSNVEPQSNVFLKIYGKVGTSVSLVAVDKSILLLRDFHRLTKDKMYSAMDGHDVGCGPGGGRNSEEVFKNAGVTVMVSHGSLNVGEREGTYCVSDELSGRRRRSLEDMLEKLDTDDLRKHFACKRGHRGIGSGSCEDKSERFLPFARRKFNIDDRELEKELVAIFIKCCEGEANDRGGSRDRSGDLFSTVFTEDVDIDTWRDTLIRKDFKESWAFIDVPIQSEGKAEFIQYTLPSSITTWSLQAFGLHHKYSMCVIDPVELVTSSEVFVQLKMPYSVIRNEHVEIQATVFYYPKSIVDQPLKVRLFLKTPREVCSEGTHDVFSAEKRFAVNPNDAYTVSFVVIGVEVGLWPISVGIVTSVKNEIVQKNLKVVAEGVERTFHHSVPLNPGEVRVRRRRRGIQTSEDCTWDDENGAQVSCLDITLPPTVIPGTESCHISLTGTRLGPAVTAVISNLGQWVNLPTGCGEQTMVGLAPNVYVLQYLIDTDSGTEEERSLALSHIDTGVAREMTYRLPEGSFSAHRNRPPSTWLTAFVAKVFCQASELTQVDSQISCGAIRWIVNYRQRANGLIHEETSVSNTALMGGLQGNLQAKIAMTAYALVAMTECSCDLEVNELPAARERAIAYLENELNDITQPYVLAMVTYALSLAGSEIKYRANTKLKRLANEDPDSESRYWGPVIQTQGQPSWSQIQASALAIETTAYALLAQIELEELRYAAGIADWLSQQQNYHGGFVSTQDTVTALQALAKFASVDTSQDLNLHCNISSPAGFTEILRVDNDDHLLQLTTKVPKQKIGGELLVKTQGEGVGTLNVEVKYNVEADYTEICPFNIVITTTSEGSSDDSEMTFNEGDELSISIEVSYLGEFKTNMAIIDFGLFTGFIPDKKSLEKVVTESSLVARYESSERSVVFYADYIPVEGESALRIEFKAVCQFKISNVYQAPVKVYDYYDPDKTCTKFYAADGSNTVDKLCIGDRCTCVSSECPSCDIEMSDSDLLDVACSGDETYVYQIYVTRVVEEGRYRLINATVLGAIKKGHDQDLQIGDYRLFSLSSACRCPDIEIRKYFIMGKNTLRFSKPDGDTFTRGYRYVIDNETIVMRWKKKLHGTFRQNMRSGLSRCQ